MKLRGISEQGGFCSISGEWNYSILVCRSTQAGLSITWANSQYRNAVASGFCTRSSEAEQTRRYRVSVLTVRHIIDDISKLPLMLQGKLDQRVTAMDTKFCADIISMVLNCADTYTELVSNLTTRQVFRNQCEQSTFRWRQ
jgi:hypothetical protein